MKLSALLFLLLPAVACGTTGGTASQTSSGSSGHGSGSTSSVSGSSSGAVGSGQSSGSSSSGSPNSSGSLTSSGTSAGASSGTVSSGVASGTSGSSGTASGGASGASASGSGGAVNIDAGLPPGAVNMVPAGYTGMPFKTLTIPGIIYSADYDTGGAGVAFCHSGTATGAAACANGIDLNDWCCGTMKGCKETAPACPIYRTDNAGLSHMNLGEPDKYASDGPTWVIGADGSPSLTGPMVTAGTAVPQNANSTSDYDAYISYMNTSQWSKYTVEVLAAGTYAVGGLMGVPAGTQITLDFGGGATTGPITLPTSPCTWAGCPETYHSWNNVSNVGMVTFTAPGTYVMTFTLVAEQFNPLFFTFSKM
jgi:hypothetical protein